MSYYVNIGFANAKSETEAIAVFLQHLQQLWDNRIRLLADNLLYMRDRSEHDLDYCISNSLSRRFLYWPEFDLCAVWAADDQEFAPDGFKIYHSFQDSTDQDYEYDSWSNEIDFFAQVKNDVLPLDRTQLFEISGYDEDDFEESDDEYVRKTALYNQIFRKLQLEDIMWDHETERIKKYRMAAFFSPDQLLPLKMYLRRFLFANNEPIRLDFPCFFVNGKYYSCFYGKSSNQFHAYSISHDSRSVSGNTITEIAAKLGVKTTNDLNIVERMILLQNLFRIKFQVPLDINLCDFLVEHEDKVLSEKYFHDEMLYLLSEANMKNFSNLALEFGVEDNSHLTGHQIFNLFMELLASVTVLFDYPFVKLKYGVRVFRTGWSKYSKMSRGVTYNLLTMERVIYPFDKFFNLNETEETAHEEVLRRMKQANGIWVADKKDGTMISVASLKNELIVSTNGAFDNIYTKIATDILIDKGVFSSEFFEPGWTYMFELICPQSKVVIDYGDERELYLLAVRNNKTGLYKNDLSLDAKRCKCPSAGYVPATPETLLAMKAKAKEKGHNAEGWVFRINDPLNDLFVKLKYKEYVDLHRSACRGVSEKDVFWYCFFSNGMESFLEKLTPELSQQAMDLREGIFVTIEMFRNEVDTQVEQIKKRFGFYTKNEFKALMADPEQRKQVKHYLSNLNPVLSGYVLSGCSDMGIVDKMLSMLNYKKFLQLRNI